MIDFHHNIFFYYKGASQPEHDRDKQIEDNTTKALINTLSHSSPETAIAFLKWLGITANEKPKLVLHKRSLGTERVLGKPHRLLLAIVGTEKTHNKLVCDQLPGHPEGDSCPDAWILGKDYVVLIESKIGDHALSFDQMACHYEKLRPRSTDIIVRTWAQLHRFFAKLAHELHNPKNRWLSGQFAQYLEWTGMTDFVGINEAIFEFFVPSERDAETKRWVRHTLEALADKLLLGDDGLKSFDGFYEKKHIGNFAQNADHYWVAFGPAEPINFREVAHQTISLYEQSVQVFVNVELLPAIKKLRKKLGPVDGEFRKLVSKLPGPFTVEIEERREAGRPRAFDYFPIARVDGGTNNGIPYGLKDPKSPGFDYICKLVNEMPLPYFSLRTHIPRKEVLELSIPNGERLVKRLLKTLKAFHPLVDFING